ncbi:glutathione S-transferase N-terminal domain-containing protein [Sphingomonas sp. Mn802worker]|uniref:glutathione S-transferase N-terminal domain-containing protein n=1 Tax=Sphingomonas sp. Mn802worker TaxID=629773 RepID=UPI000475C157|nr:glutathione S-transferase N-terminal domain-containing protein [Sphingomonas sp. Mn802worker]
MTTLTDFPITRRWPATHPDRIQLYSLNTPNGVKASIMLEETGLPYEAHLIDFAQNDQKSDAFVSLNPNGKIPAMIDPAGPGGVAVGIFESGAILLYLAEKTGKLLPTNPAVRWQAISWVMFQMGGVGPMFGQLGFFHKFAGKDWEDKRPRDRYVDESRRLLGVMDRALAGKEWFVGDYSIADIAMLGWVRALRDFYKAGDLVGFDEFGHVKTWLDRGLARPAVQRGLAIPSKD